jgi:hypothetical protein
MGAVDRYTREAARRRAEEDRAVARIVAIVCLLALLAILLVNAFAPSQGPPRDPASICTQWDDC